MLNSMLNGFCWISGVMLFFIVFGIMIIGVLMIIRKITDDSYFKDIKK